MKRIVKPLSILLAILTVFAVSPISFAAVDAGSIAVGDKVSFGTYEQDGDAKTTGEVIVWQVVEKNENVLTIITEKCLNASTKFSNAKNKLGVWGKSNLVRTTFIPAFISTAFTAKEKAALVGVDNGATAADETTALVGDEALDLVYIPSKAELEAYFPNASDRITYNTVSAGNSTNAAKPDKSAAKYFLRDSGYSKNAQTKYCCYVDESGEFLIPDSSTKTSSLITSNGSLGKIAVRLVAKIDLTKLFSNGKDTETNVISLLGTLGTYTVRWMTPDGTVVAEELVDHGDAAVKNPDRDMSVLEGSTYSGYKFVGWDKEYNCITANTDIYAVFEEKPNDSKFMAMARWIWGIVELVSGLVTTNLIPMINEWLSENLGFTLPIGK